MLPAGNEDTIVNYLTQMRKGQPRDISFAIEQIADEYKLSVSLVPRFDTDVRNIYRLAELGTLASKKIEACMANILTKTATLRTVQSRFSGLWEARVESVRLAPVLLYE